MFLTNRKSPLSQHQWETQSNTALDYAGLLTSLSEEHDYLAEVEGEIPPIQGRLYRNGPGLYHRANMRKRMALDGDGMIQAFDFDGSSKVRFRNRFVRTQKFEAEEKANQFLYPTWSTLAPGSFRKNFGGHLANQAGVTVIEWNGELYAMDEGHPAYVLNPETLSTKGIAALDPAKPDQSYLAHWKLDSIRNKWLNCSLQYGKNLRFDYRAFFRRKIGEAL